MRNFTFETPIVIVAFRRADLLIETLNAVEKIRPKRVFFIQDWYNDKTLQFARECHATSSVLQSIEWPCEITYIKADYNMGLKNRIESGLDEVFAQVNQAVIIEDDIRVSVEGFYFLQSMLNEYCVDESIWHINCSNLVSKFQLPKNQYRFSQYAHSWGWGTWADRWSKYDGDLKFWPEYSESVSFRQRFEHRPEMAYWKDIFDDVYFGRNTSSWAYPWLAAMWFHEAQAISPNVNYALNNGFDKRATHTTYAPRQSIDLWSSEEIKSEVLKAPESKRINIEADKDEYLYHYGGKFRRLKNSRMGNWLNQIRLTAARFRNSN
jgi:hypothetical protein